MTAPKPRSFLLLAQHRPQPAANEAIQLAKLPWVGVLEVAKPAFQDRIERLNDPLEAHPLCAAGLAPQFVLQGFQAFLTSKLTTAPNVAGVKTSLTIRTSKDLPGVPVEA